MAHRPIVDLSTHPYKYVTPDEFARYLGVSRSLIYSQMQKGALAKVTIGYILRIPIEEARRYASVPDRDCFAR